MDALASGRVKVASDIRGHEYDWLARDADDHVALFSAAEGGYAPASIPACTSVRWWS
jgi:hypothetical protein